MSEVDTLFKKYVEEHRAGRQADPRAFLAQASAEDRRELAALIDGYLTRVPPHSVDLERFRDSSLERTLDDLERVLAGHSGLWPSLLPRLRERVGLEQREVVQQLADALGVANKAAKVAAYYHQMEQGILPERGVADRVLDALGGLLGESAGALRDAATGFGQGGGPNIPQSAAMVGHGHLEAASAPPSVAAEASLTDAWDEVDELFRGA